MGGYLSRGALGLGADGRLPSVAVRTITDIFFVFLALESNLASYFMQRGCVLSRRLCLVVLAKGLFVLDGLSASHVRVRTDIGLRGILVESQRVLFNPHRRVTPFLLHARPLGCWPLGMFLLCGICLLHDDGDFIVLGGLVLGGYAGEEGGEVALKRAQLYDLRLEHQLYRRK
jgi:hypothetical protein